MNILDENIQSDQRQPLESWHFRIFQIGFNIGRRGMQDDEIISFLLQQRRPTFLTRDEHFYERQLCHRGYCLVYLAAGKSETAIFVRRLLSHPELDTQAKRMGTVVYVSTGGISLWHINSHRETHLSWLST